MYYLFLIAYLFWETRRWTVGLDAIAYMIWYNPPTNFVQFSPKRWLNLKKMIKYL